MQEYRFVVGTDTRPSVSNISLEGVMKSAFNIIRAARFCNLECRSIFELDKFPRYCTHNQVEVQ